MESQNWFYISRDASIATAELSHKINCWRQNVDLCTRLDPTNSPFQYPFPCETVPSSFAPRPRNLKRRKPYARPPDLPLHQRTPQMDISDLCHAESMPFFDIRQFGGAPEVAKRMVDDNGGISGVPTSIKDSSGVDLPHPEKNPLVKSSCTCH